MLRPGGRIAMTVWDVPEVNAAIGSIGAVVADAGQTAAVPAGPDSARFADDAQIRALRARYVEVARQRWDTADGRVELTAAAVLLSAARPASGP